MSRQYNIHWKRSDYSKLSHLVRKVNKKIFEIEVKRPDITGYQPEYLDYKTLKSQIKTRHDLNKVMSRYKRYLEEGAEEIITTKKGGVLTKWQRKEIAIFDRTENAKRTRLKKELEKEQVKVAGKDTGFNRVQMGNMKEADIKHRKHNIDDMKQNDINAITRLIDKKIFDSYELEKKKGMIENYVKGLISEGYSDELINLMNQIDVDEFIKVINTDEVATFDFIYEPLELKARQEQLLDLWEMYRDDSINNNINFDSIRSDVKAEYLSGERAKGKGRIKRKRRR